MDIVRNITEEELIRNIQTDNFFGELCQQRKVVEQRYARDLRQLVNSFSVRKEVDNKIGMESR